MQWAQCRRASQTPNKATLIIINFLFRVEISVENDDSYRNEVEVDQTFEDAIEIDQVEEVNSTVATKTNVVTRSPDVDKLMKDPKTICKQTFLPSVKRYLTTMPKKTTLCYLKLYFLLSFYVTIIAILTPTTWSVRCERKMFYTRHYIALQTWSM